MRVLIVGSGPAGAIVGARLIEKGVDTSFLVRPERQPMLMTRGLQVRSPFGRVSKPVMALTSSEIEGTYDIVIIATRAHLFEVGLEAASRAIGRKTVVVSMSDGVRALDLSAADDGPRIIAAVLEARAMIDADGIILQRPPKAELTVGAVESADMHIVADLAELFNARGLFVSIVDDIRSRAWERFGFLAAAVAATTLKRRPLRDTFRFAHGASDYENLLRQALAVGQAASYAPDPLRFRAYRNAFLLEGRPVQAPPMIGDDGSAGDEAALLLAEMITIAQRAQVRASLFDEAWRVANSPTRINASAETGAEVA